MTSSVVGTRTRLAPLVVYAFWTLALLRVFELPMLPRSDPAAARLLFLARVGCVLGILAIVGFRAIERLGTSASLFMASFATHFVIGGVLALTQFSALKLAERGGLMRQHVVATATFFAFVVGARLIIDRWGLEKFLRGVQVLLMAACFVVVSMPLALRAGLPFPPGFFPHEIRFFGAFTNPSISSFAGGTIAIWGMARLDGRREIGVSLLAMTLGAFTVFASFAKIGMISFLAVLVFFLVVGGNVRRLWILAWIGAFVVVAAATLASIGPSGLVVHQAERIVEAAQFLSGDTSDSVLSNRGFLIRMAWEKYLESPVLGLGYGEADRMEGAPYIGMYEQIRAGAHNHYLSLAAEAGVIPLFFFLAALISLLRPLWTLPRSWTTYLVAGVGVQLACLTVAEGHMQTWPSSMFILAVCCAVGAHAADERRRSAMPEATAQDGG